MRKHTYRLYDMALYDYQYIQRHLTEMAAKGWRLDKISTMGLWRYRRAEPAQLRYEVTYAPSASAYNSRPTDQEEALTDICAEAGWEKVASVAQLHIYCTEDLNATPIETDELSRIQTLRKAMNRHLIPQNLLLAFLFALQTGLQLQNLTRWPVNGFTSPLMAGNILLLSIVSLCYLIIPLGYFLWSRRAEQAARDGLPVPECVFYRRFRWVLWLVVAAYLFIIMAALDAPMAVGALAMALVMLLGVGFTVDLCKEAGAPRWLNFAAAFIVSFLLMAILFPFVFGVLDNDSLSEEPQAPADVTLSITDLLETDAEPFTIAYEESSTPLASKVRLWQGARDSTEELSYTIVDADLGFVYEACLNELEQEFLSSAAVLTGGIIETNQCDLWEADYVRRIASDSGDRWFLCWEDRIVTLRASWTLTEAQIRMVTEKLKP